MAEGRLAWRAVRVPRRRPGGHARHRSEGPRVAGWPRPVARSLRPETDLCEAHHPSDPGRL